MGILGARFEDAAACLAGDADACDRVYVGYFLWPRLQKILEDLKLAELPPIIEPIPRPDPPPVFRGEPNPQPNSWHVLAMLLLADRFGEPTHGLHEARVRATQRFRQGLKQLVEQLDQELEKAG